MTTMRTTVSIWILFPAVTMSLGWGLRGFIGGGPLGAMIPGAMVVLALALLLERKTSLGFIAACGAVGVGFGGQETYGQTVGLSLKPETFWWAMTGFAVKGGAWGLLGGIVMALGFLREKMRVKARDVAAGVLAMIAATWLGWKLVNSPKLIYFSNPVDKPREEAWFGLLLGGLVLLGWLLWKGGGRAMVEMALLGLVGGGVGFAVGAAIQAVGRPTGPAPFVDWWKIMEFTFGALLGAAYGWAAWRNREALSGDEGAAWTGSAGWKGLAAAAALALIGIGLEYKVELPFTYTIAGALLLVLAMAEEAWAWQIAMAVTCCAFFMDAVENKEILQGVQGYLFIGLATAAVAWVTARRPVGKTMFLVMTWSAVGVSLVKVLAPPMAMKFGAAATEAVFVLMAVAATWWARRLTAETE
ncbi:MAG: hypothetical protein HY821_15645 [Acidobacteria bacterium]|nr:hypothetical protein [Acidobacteriota bacterium]